MNRIFVPIVIFPVAVLGSYIYFRIASVYGPYATPNHRSLHKRVTPRGGGIVIVAPVLLGVLWMFVRGEFGLTYLLVFFAGGLIVGGAGFADDVFDIRPRYRLALQFLAASGLAFAFGGLPQLNLGFAQIRLGLLGYAIVIGAFLWFYNLFNFIDGIDAM